MSKNFNQILSDKIMQGRIINFVQSLSKDINLYMATRRAALYDEIDNKIMNYIKNQLTNNDTRFLMSFELIKKFYNII